MDFFNPLSLVAGVSVAIGVAVSDIRNRLMEADETGQRLQDMEYCLIVDGVHIAGSVGHDCISFEGLDAPLVLEGSLRKLKVLLYALKRQTQVSVMEHQLHAGKLLVVLRCCVDYEVEEYLLREGS